jgi:microcystin-dependent protein
MALVVRDRVKQFSVTSGTGTLTLGSTPNGFQSFSTIGDGNTTYYTIVNGNTGDFEVGIGTYTLSGDTLSRDTVLASSNSGNLVNFNADSKDVFVVYPAERAVFTDVVQTLTNKTISGANNTLSNIPNSATTATNANTASAIVARDASGNFSAGTITAALSGNATTSSSTTGNAATATALQNARTIGGVSFDGTANINLPGVNTAGNQNTTGTAANVTGTVAIANGGTGATTQQTAINALAGAVTSAQYLRGNGTNILMSAIQAADVPTLNQNTTGSAATLTTGRTIAITGDLTYTSGSFNGSANVTGTGTLANSGVVAGTYTKVTVDAKGRVTVGASLAAGDVPTLNQNTTGTAANVTGTVAIANGGTGGTTAQAARNNIAAAVTSGQYLRGNGTNVLMSAIQAADVPTLNQNTTGTAANVTGTVAIANGGTGGTTAQAARNNIAGAVTSAQYLRGNGTNVLMSAIQAADVPTLNQNTTGSAASLTTARAINGTNFNGTANITTANWGTARTLTIGSTGKSVNGSANVSWTLAEIGAAPAAAGIPAGSVIYVAMNTAPTGFLKANGAAVSRTTFAALFAAIGTTFGAGDGSTTFNVPDIRGEFMRGWDDGRGIDSGRAFGSFQATRVNNVANFAINSSGSPGVIYGINPIPDNGTESTRRYVAGTNGPNAFLSMTKNGGDTYPRNRALLACIKF